MRLCCWRAESGNESFVFLQPFQRHSRYQWYHLPWWCALQDRCPLACRCRHPPAWASCPFLVRWCLDRATLHKDYLPTSCLPLAVLCPPPCLCRLGSPCLRLVGTARLELQQSKDVNSPSAGHIHNSVWGWTTAVLGFFSLLHLIMVLAKLFVCTWIMTVTDRCLPFILLCCKDKLLHLLQKLHLEFNGAVPHLPTPPPTFCTPVSARCKWSVSPL